MTRTSLAPRWLCCWKSETPTPAPPVARPNSQRWRRRATCFSGTGACVRRCASLAGANHLPRPGSWPINGSTRPQMPSPGTPVRVSRAAFASAVAASSSVTASPNLLDLPEDVDKALPASPLAAFALSPTPAAPAAASATPAAASIGPTDLAAASESAAEKLLRTQAVLADMDRLLNDMDWDGGSSSDLLDERHSVGSTDLLETDTGTAGPAGAARPTVLADKPFSLLGTPGINPALAKPTLSFTRW